MSKQGDNQQDGGEKELQTAINVLCELRDLRKKQIFLAMLDEIKFLKQDLDNAVKTAEFYRRQSQELSIENDWLHSLTGTPSISPFRKDLQWGVDPEKVSIKLKQIQDTFSQSKKIEDLPKENSGCQEEEDSTHPKNLRRQNPQRLAKIEAEYKLKERRNAETTRKGRGRPANARKDKSAK